MRDDDWDSDEPKEIQIVNSPSDLLDIGSVLEQHSAAVMYESIADDLKLQAILKRGQLYKQFDGTQRECAEYFGVSLGTINEYRTIYDNQAFISDEQQIEKNKLLTIIRKHKAEEEEVVEDFELTREQFQGGTTYRSDEAEALADEVVDMAADEAPEVKVALGNKAIGVSQKKQVLESDLGDAEKVKAMKSKKNFDRIILGKEDKAPPKNLTDAKDRNKTLAEENSELKARNKELEKKLKDFNFIEELAWHSLRLGRMVTQFAKMKTESKSMYENMKPNIANALQLLKLPTTQEVTIDEVKRAFRDEAKAHHPDVGGDTEVFHKVKEAYDLLKGHLNGKK